MPRIITKKFVDATFRVQWPGGDVDEYIDVKPLATSVVRELFHVIQNTVDPAEKIREMGIRCVAEAIVNWSGFASPDGEELPYSKEAVRHIAEYQPEIYAQLDKLVSSAISAGKIIVEE